MIFIIIFLYFCLAVFGLTVIAGAVLHFKGASGQGLKKALRRTARSQVRPPFGKRDEIERILAMRLDE